MIHALPYVCRLFARERHLKPLFLSKMHPDNRRPSDSRSESDVEFDDEKVKAHGQIVMEALGEAVECLHDSEQLTLLLVGKVPTFSYGNTILSCL